LSVSIVPFIVFPCLSHLALHHPVLHFSCPFLSLSQPICFTNFIPPESCPPGETAVQEPQRRYEQKVFTKRMETMKRPQPRRFKGKKGVEAYQNPNFQANSRSGRSEERGRGG
jgi:hypothetical protein